MKAVTTTNMLPTNISLIYRFDRGSNVTDVSSIFISYIIKIIMTPIHNQQIAADISIENVISYLSRLKISFSNSTSLRTTIIKVTQ